MILVLPSDHIAGKTQFQKDVAAARAAAEKGLLVTFGIKPTAPATGYGYIETGEKLQGAVHRIARFVEKRMGKSFRPWRYGATRFSDSPAPWSRFDGAQWGLCRLASRY